MTDLPFPPFSEAWPWLAGQWAALLLVAFVAGVASWVGSKERSRRLGAIA